MLHNSSYSYRREKPANPLWKLFSLIIVFSILASLSLCLKGSFLGFAPGENEEKTENVMSVEDGTTVVNTSSLAKDIKGYGGPVPVEIYISGAKIDSVRPLSNSETPSFFSRLESEGLLAAWDGKTLREAATMKVDAVSGATFSSRALIANVQAGAGYAMDNGADVGSSLAGNLNAGFSWSLFCALIVALMAAVIPLFTKNPTYRFIQQLLNVGVLGFWTGTFIDYAVMINVAAYGFSFSMAGIICIILLVVGFIYPLFGKPGHYCAWVCPLGSLQELSGRLVKAKINTSRQAAVYIGYFRDALWAILIFILWLGTGTEWIDNELFSAFIVKSASWTVIIIGLLFILLSIFVPRPFCRFICPTGTLLRKSSDLNRN